MLSRINVFKIIRAHFNTLKKLNEPSSGIATKDVFLFFIMPGVVALILTYSEFWISHTLSNLIAAIAILGGFLFNLLAIIYNSMSNIEEDAKKNEIKNRFKKEIHSNISFCILLALFLLITLLISSVSAQFIESHYVFNICLLFLNYFLLFVFLLTLLMVLNRVYILLDKNL